MTEKFGIIILPRIILIQHKEILIS